MGHALNFTERGQVRIEVAVLPVTPQQPLRLLFTVSDTGIGIPDDRLRDVFEPVTQVESDLTRRFQGAGLGLSIVRKLVMLMDGDLAIDSTEGEGTTVSLALPFGLPK